MKTTLIAVGYGADNGAQFTCSLSIDDPSLDISDAVACRDTIAKGLNLSTNVIDEVLVMQNNEVVQQHGGQDGF